MFISVHGRITISTATRPGHAFWRQLVSNDAGQGRLLEIFFHAPPSWQNVYLQTTRLLFNSPRGDLVFFSRPHREGESLREEQFRSAGTLVAAGQTALCYISCQEANVRNAMNLLHSPCTTHYIHHANRYPCLAVWTFFFFILKFLNVVDLQYW